MHRSKLLSLILVFAILSAGSAMAATSQSIATALDRPDRLEGDADKDSGRKPTEVLAFFDIEPGMTVLEMFSGGGYYSEILSYVVGGEGTVHAHNNKPYIAYAKKSLEKRYTSGRLDNVKRFEAENNELELSAGKFDAALLILAYHDVYHVDEKNGWFPIDGPKMLAEIYGSMKPGAVLGVVDHVAKAGSPPETGQTLHRIDPQLMKKEIEAAGFVFDGEIDVLRNPGDDLAKPMYAPEVRGKTDRVVYRFHRP
ncbi:MAG: class I SAM-dependent methyltransferase [Gammaproteobacteria bacterium]